MIPMKNASSDMNSAERPMKQTHQAKRAGDRVAVDHDRGAETEHDQRENPKENKRHQGMADSEIAGLQTWKSNAATQSQILNT